QPRAADVTLDLGGRAAPRTAPALLRDFFAARRQSGGARGTRRRHRGGVASAAAGENGRGCERVCSRAGERIGAVTRCKEFNAPCARRRAAGTRRRRCPAPWAWP